MSRLPVSSSINRELGSCHCVLKASRKLSKLKNSTTVFGSKRARAQDKPLPHNYPQQGLRSRNCHRIQGWSRNIWTVDDEFLDAQCEKPWELKTARGPSHRAPHPTVLWDLSPETQPNSHNKYQRKIFVCFLHGEGKRDHVEIWDCILPESKGIILKIS